MRTLLRWIDDRSGLSLALRNGLDRPVPGGACWCRIWPFAILLTFCIQAVTGFFLWAYYSPSAQTAWESVYFLQYHVVGGWLLRAVHHYSAQVTLALIGIYVIQMIVTGAYRAPRELVFWSAVLMGLLCLGLLLTGDLLAWDQNSYSSTKVRVSFLTMLPAIGGGLFKLAAGGPEFGHLTLTRFLALHAGLMPALFVVLLALHAALSRRADVALAAEARKVGRYWPNQAVINAVAGLAVLGVILALALQHGLSGDHAGVALGAPADPAADFAAARPEWAFLGLYEFSHLFPGTLAILPIFVIPNVLILTVLAMPWIARHRAGHVLNVALTAVLLVGLVGLSYRSVAKDRRDPVHQAALADALQQADRAMQLAVAPQGIPVGGALTLLRNDPKTQGPILFKSQCAACHDYVNAKGNGIKAEKSSAPNLFEYATRRWLTGLLDAGRIGTPAYFGNTKFKNAEMAAQVKEWWADAKADDAVDLVREELGKVAAAVSAEAGLKSQVALDAKDAAVIAEGKGMIVDLYSCIDCHKFQNKGQLGTAPDLTGYASRAWLVGIIGNPAHRRFYGSKNDRMPAYAEFPNEPAKNTLSPHDIGLLTDWLRGEWYEP